MKDFFCMVFVTYVFYQVKFKLIFDIQVENISSPKLGDARPRMTLGFLINGMDYITKEELATEFELSGF